VVGVPGVRSGLKGLHPPGEALPIAMQKMAEEKHLDIVAEFSRRVMPAVAVASDALRRRPLPLAMEPGARDQVIVVVRIAFGRVLEDLPRSPRILLIPESGDIEIRDGRAV